MVAAYAIHHDEDPFCHNILSYITLKMGMIRHFNISATWYEMGKMRDKQQYDHLIHMYNGLPSLPTALKTQLKNSRLVNRELEPRPRNKKLQHACFARMQTADDADYKKITTAYTDVGFDFQRTLSPYFCTLRPGGTQPWVDLIKHSEYNDLYIEAMMKKNTISAARYAYMEAHIYAKHDHNCAMLLPEYHKAHKWYINITNFAWRGEGLTSHQPQQHNNNNNARPQVVHYRCGYCDDGTPLTRDHLLTCQALLPQRVHAYNSMLYFVRKKKMAHDVSTILRNVETTKDSILDLIKRLPLEWDNLRHDLAYHVAKPLYEDATKWRSEFNGVNHLALLEQSKRGKTHLAQWLQKEKQRAEAEGACEEALFTYTPEFANILRRDMYTWAHQGFSKLFPGHKLEFPKERYNLDKVFAEIFNWDRSTPMYNQLYFKMRYLIIIFYLHNIDRNKLHQLPPAVNNQQ